MALGVLGWRVLPWARVAHLVSWDPTSNRSRYETACGTVALVSYVDDNPAAKHCKKCERKAPPQSQDTVGKERP